MENKKGIGISNKRIAVLTSGSITGILAPASPRYDKYRESPNGMWQSPETWGPYGRQVHGFSMHGRFEFEVGDTIELSDISGSDVIFVKILAITMIEGANISEDDLKLTRFKDRAAWETEGLGDRRGWLMRVEILPETRPGKTGPLNVELYNSETGETETREI